MRDPMTRRSALLLVIWRGGGIEGVAVAIKGIGMRSSHGFTLLELLMVVIIIGILAAIAMPQYLKVTERSRASEALDMLGHVRGSEARFLAENVFYTNNISLLDFDPTTAVGTPFFAYNVPANAATTYVVAATRNATGFSTTSGCVTGYRIRINENGVYAGRDCQSTLLTVP